jgi:hypothetical protein
MTLFCYLQIFREKSLAMGGSRLAFSCDMSSAIRLTLSATPWNGKISV